MMRGQRNLHVEEGVLSEKFVDNLLYVLGEKLILPRIILTMKRSGFNKHTGFKRKTGLKNNGKGLKRSTLPKSGIRRKGFGKSNNKPKSVRDKLIADIDKYFSRYIRLFHAREDKKVYCFTSGKLIHWKYIQAGHFESRGNKATRWKMYNVWPQCNYDNAVLEGNIDVYTQNLIDIYGTEFVDNIHKKADSIKYHSIEELKSLKEQFLGLYKNVKQSKLIGKSYDSGLIMFIDPMNHKKHIIRKNGKYRSVYIENNSL